MADTKLIPEKSYPSIIGLYRAYLNFMYAGVAESGNAPG